MCEVSWPRQRFTLHPAEAMQFRKFGSYYGQAVTVEKAHHMKLVCLRTYWIGSQIVAINAY